MAKCYHIHKLIGYGIHNLKVADGEIIDERINKEGAIFLKRPEGQYNFYSFCDFLEKEEYKWFVDIFSMSIFEPSFFDYVHFLPKQGIIVLVPPNKSHIWSRVDNPLDAVLEKEMYKSQTNYRVFTNPISPYNNFINRKTKKTIIESEVKIMASRPPEIIPMIPQIIFTLAKWIKLFNDDEFIYDLRPMSLSYWK